MDWTPTNAPVLQNASSRGIKRTYDDLSRQPESPQLFNPYVGQYMPGGWPVSPGADQVGDIITVAPMSGTLNMTLTRSQENRNGPASPEVATSLPQANLIFRAVKRFCLGIASRFPTGKTIQFHRTRFTPKPKRSSGTPSTPPEPAISDQPPSTVSKTPQSSVSSTFLSSNVPSTPDLSDVEEERGDAHMHHPNKNELVPVQNITPAGPMEQDSNTAYLRCANPKLLRKLGLTQTPTPPDSPKEEPVEEEADELVDEAVDASLTPPATPLAEPRVNYLRPAIEIWLKSPYPKLRASLFLRSPFKFGQTPSLASSPTYVAARHSGIADQEAVPKLVLPELDSIHPQVRVTSNSESSATSCLQHTPSAQLLAESMREHSPILEASTPDPYHTKSPISPPISGELSAEQQSRYATRSLAKQKAEASRQMSGYNIEPLSKEWEAKVEHALKHGHGPYTTHDLVKVVPPIGSKTTSQWLNDETINGYLKLVTDLGNKAQTATAIPKYHAFTSFFMTTLLEKGYEGIKRWSKRAKIDGKKLLDVQDVFIPINRNLHWTMLVVSPKHRAIRYYDSLGGNGRPYVVAAIHWLRGELGPAFIEGDWMIDNAAPSPMQNNGSDCGVFAITTAKQLMLGRSPMGYGPKEIPIQRRRIVAELVAGKLL
jgi:Ulp1 protease family, C-terminal catalytic domain